MLGGCLRPELLPVQNALNRDAAVFSRGHDRVG